MPHNCYAIILNYYLYRLNFVTFKNSQHQYQMSQINISLAPNWYQGHLKVRVSESFTKKTFFWATTKVLTHF